MSAGTIFAVMENPYPGLRAFEEEDCHRFFGRDQQIDELLDRLSRSRFVAIVGLSGTGKSSLVKAGLIPALRGGYVARSKSRWRIATCRPGDNAISSLAEALKEKAQVESNLQISSHALVKAARQLDSDESLLVVVDQFEELFRYKERLRAKDEGSRLRDAESAADFVRLLLTAAHNEDVSVYVVLTMRSDYLGDCAQFRDLPEALNGGQYLVPRMTRVQRREAIEGPLGPNTRIAPRLVQQLLNVADDEPNQLPVLQHTLMRMWDLHGSAAGEIGTANYEQSGGFEDALNRHAQQTYLSLGSDHRRKLAQWIFQRLTQKGRSERETCGPTKLTGLCAVCGAETEEQKRTVADVVEHFRQPPATFLSCKDEKLTLESIIDITHETLIEKWRGLKTWVEQEATSAKAFLGLLDDAKQWRRGRKEPLGGMELHDAEEWYQQRNPNAAWALNYASGDTQPLVLVQDYLKASRKNESKKERRRQILWAAIGAALVFLALALVAWSYKVRAERSSTLSRARQLAANADLLYSYSGDPQLPGLLATESMLRAPLAENHASVRKLLALPRQVSRVEMSEPVRKVVFSPDSRWVAAASDDDTARVWEADTGKEIARFNHNGPVSSVSFSPNGRWVATARDDASAAGASNYVSGKPDHAAHIWDVASGKELVRLQHEGPVTSIVFSPDSQWVATASRDQTSRIWDVTTGKELVQLKHRGLFLSIVFSPDGHWIASAGFDGTARVWEAASGKELARLQHEGPVTSIVFSPDGRWIASASSLGTTHVWEAVSGKELARLQHEGRVNSVVFSPNGRWVASASIEPTARIWEAATGKVIAHLQHDGPINSVVFSSDGRWVATASDDNTARVWEASSGNQIARLAHNNFVNSVVFSSDGRWVATASFDKTVRVWEAASRNMITRLKHNNLVNSATFSPDGHWVASASIEPTALIWEAATGKVIAHLQHDGPVNSIVFSPDGRWVASASSDHTARVWDSSSGKELVHLQHAGRVNSVVFSPDSRWLASASSDHTARIWEAASGKELTRIQHEGAVSSVVFSPDGRWVASTSFNTVRVWEATSGKKLTDIKHDNFVYSVVFSPDGNRVASSSFEAVRIWETTSGKELTHLKHDSSVYSVIFSPDGRRVASGSQDGLVRVWQASTGDEIFEIKLPQAVVNLEFFGNSRLLANTAEGSAHILDVANQYEITHIPSDGAILATYFSNDRHTITFASRIENEVRITRALLLPQDLINEACSHLTRNLSVAEWKQYIGDERYRRTCSNLSFPPDYHDTQ